MERRLEPDLGPRLSASNRFVEPTIEAGRHIRRRRVGTSPELVAEDEIACESLPLVEAAETVPEATLEAETGSDRGRHPPFITTVIHDSPERVERAFDSPAFAAEYR